MDRFDFKSSHLLYADDLTALNFDVVGADAVLLPKTRNDLRAVGPGFEDAGRTVVAIRLD